MFNDFSYPLYLRSLPVPYSSLDQIRIVKTAGQRTVLFLYGNETPSELVEVNFKESGLSGQNLLFLLKFLYRHFLSYLSRLLRFPKSCLSRLCDDSAAAEKSWYQIEKL